MGRLMGRIEPSKSPMFTAIGTLGRMGRLISPHRGEKNGPLNLNLSLNLFRRPRQVEIAPDSPPPQVEIAQDSSSRSHPLTRPISPYLHPPRPFPPQTPFPF